MASLVARLSNVWLTLTAEFWSFNNRIDSQQPIFPVHTHGPQNRSQWRDGFDLYTDYEVDIPPGKLVEVSENPTGLGIGKANAS